MPVAVYIFVLIQLFFVAYIDLKTKKISNYWSILNIATFIIIHILFRETYQLSWVSFYYSTVFLIVGFSLYLLKVMGAGDTKYLFSFYLLVPVQMQEEAFVSLLVSTIFIGTAYLLQRVIGSFKIMLNALKRHDTSFIRTILGGKFSYAPVILISWMWFGWIARKSIY